MKKEDLISEIEEAFGRVSPRGLCITINSDMGDYPDVRRHFYHRDWWTCDAKYLKQQDGAFTFMTDEARAYFTPAFMIASLVDPAAADTVPDNFVSNLTESLLRQYDLPKLKAVKNFIEFSLSEDSWKHNGWRRKLALAQSIEHDGGLKGLQP
jgi:hypothetical protein